MLNKVYKFVIIFVSIILIVGGYLVFFFDPDNFKTEIEEYVSSKINYTFVYDGKLDIGIYSPTTNVNGDENDISNFNSKLCIFLIARKEFFDETHINALLFLKLLLLKINLMKFMAIFF